MKLNPDTTIEAICAALRAEVPGREAFITQRLFEYLLEHGCSMSAILLGLQFLSEERHDGTLSGAILTARLAACRAESQWLKDERSRS